MKQFDKNKVKKILLIRNDKIGDIITSSGLPRELRKIFPKAKITFIASNVNRALIKKNKNINEIIALDYSPRKLGEFLEYFRIMRKLRREKYDLGIDLRGGLFNILFFLYFAGVRYRIGFYNQYIGKFFLHDPWDRYKYKPTNNSVILRRDLINKSLGLNIKNYWPEIVTDEEDQKMLGNLMKEKKLRRFICIVPDASLELKQWPLGNFDLLIKYLKKRYPRKQIVLVGTSRDKISWLAKKNPQVITILDVNLRVLYLLFKKSDLVIAHDGGPMHLAWVGRSKLLALITKHFSLPWVKPLGKNSRFIYADLSKLSVEKVENEVKRILG